MDISLVPRERGCRPGGAFSYLLLLEVNEQSPKFVELWKQFKETSLLFVLKPYKSKEEGERRSYFILGRQVWKLVMPNFALIPMCCDADTWHRFGCRNWFDNSRRFGVCDP
ncbi:hypothetical protein GOP47_0013751 [Adiantum capillus-veneris]|uniref:Uncharacterized protein n=1 Tax=Adiantum capillus-veneris TaxID=13818 RepID=A0A9D4ZFN5_ADICA|nr:hypothetical protein GOP47_0013751 [Adiantum capillus-veneris]